MKINILYIITILSFFSCINEKKININIQENNFINEQEIEQIIEPLILGGKPYIDQNGRAYKKEEASLIHEINISFYQNNPLRWINLDGIEQLVNLNEIIIGGDNLDEINFSPISSLLKLEYFHVGGNISYIPDLSNLVNLKKIYIRDSQLENLNGIGAPNVENIYISSNKAIINSLAPLNNLLHLKYLYITCNNPHNENSILNVSDMTNLPNLKTLEFEMWFAKINLHGIELLTELEQISISSETISPEGIGKLNNLKKLYMRFFSAEPSLVFLKNMSRLSNLTLSSHHDTLSKGPYQILDVSPLATINSLTNLACLNFIIKNLTSLDSLKIRSEDTCLIFTGSRLFDESERSRHNIDFTTSD